MSTSEISPVASPAAPAQSGKAWFRHPMMWLVVGGPVVVVCASLTTAVIAVRGADPVLDRDDPSVTVNIKDGADGNTPAMQARNHAATPKP
ncbi:nitrogen fixation protein FixH [Ideonella margarita]|jgi:hypothetical protein|uniref:Nitrogen fixation protein FixH n=1 Tax=Ideonella margarita TaxID=2984191 RepID=A0ABU9C2R4_9BURK